MAESVSVTVALMPFVSSTFDVNASGRPNVSSCAAIRFQSAHPPPPYTSRFSGAGDFWLPIVEFSTHPPIVMNKRSSGVRSTEDSSPSFTRSIRVAIFRFIAVSKATSVTCTPYRKSTPASRRKPVSGMTRDSYWLLSVKIRSLISGIVPICGRARSSVRLKASALCQFSRKYVLLHVSQNGEASTSASRQSLIFFPASCPSVCMNR